ncbi:hypothetical protein ACWGKU_15270 [Kitasatospora sp. NPDC054768]
MELFFDDTNFSTGGFEVVMKGRYLRQFAAEAREAREQGEQYFVTGVELSRAGMIRPDRALKGLDEVIEAVERVGWRHVDTQQVLTRFTLYFVRT